MAIDLQAADAAAQHAADKLAMAAFMVSPRCRSADPDTAVRIAADAIPHLRTAAAALGYSLQPITDKAGD